jgi:integrase
VAPRKIKPRRLGCWIEATRSGVLRVRFRWHLPAKVGLHKFSENTTLKDTPENRAELTKQAAIIGAEISANRFDYLRWFPNGSRATYFQQPARSPVVQSAAENKSTVGQFYQEWIARKLPPIVRPSRARDYRNHFRTYILPYLNETALKDLSLAHLEELRVRLQIDRHLSIKTVRNVIDGSLRAMLRDARKSGLDAGFPFGDLEWPRRVVPGPEPFTEEERDQLLEFVLRKRWRLGRHLGAYREVAYYPYYAFLFTLFFTGLRPSEAVALRIRSLDLSAGTLFVERSRSLRSESAPKTSAAARVVRLTASNVEILRQLIELRAEPDDYVFKNSLGNPIDQRSFYKIFCGAQRTLGIRLRDLYATKDTYVSVALTNGVNLTWLSEQTGVMENTLRTHYGRFIHASQADALELVKIDPSHSKRGEFAPRLPHAVAVAREKSWNYKEKMVEQKGFEPSTPTLRTWCSPS